MTRAFTWACAAVVAGWATIARADTYPRQPGVDAWHYVFTLELSDTSAEIAGEATVDVRFTRDGVTTVALDLGSLANGKGMTVTSVTSDGKAVRFVHQHNVLTLPLQTPSTTGRHVRFTIAYHGAPAGGLRILPNKHGDWSAFSENWPNHAREWLPDDRPSVRQGDERVHRHGASTVSGRRERLAAGGNRPRATAAG